MPDYILKFEKNVHTALWGEEQWLVSVHPSGPVTIANGPLAGKSLAEVCPDFPVLVKVIDAKRRLSVQVHPNERTAPATGGEPKTEMWCMLDDGVIYAGLKPGVRAGDVAALVLVKAAYVHDHRPVVLLHHLLCGLLVDLPVARGRIRRLRAPPFGRAARQKQQTGQQQDSCSFHHPGSFSCAILTPHPGTPDRIWP